MEKKISKINLKKQRIRTAIFSGICISRQELIRQTGFSGRTVDNYTNELKRHGLILEETAEGQRGRPGIITAPTVNGSSLSAFLCSQVSCVLR